MFEVLCFTNTVSSYPGNLVLLKTYASQNIRTCLNINHPFKQKFHNLILFQATQPVKKVSSGTKRKASLMDKSCKDHTAKKQKMAEAKPSTALSKPTRKPDIKWIKW